MNRKFNVSLFVCCYLLMVCFSTKISAQPNSTYYYQQQTLFESLPVQKNKVIFCGNSITDGGEWQEIFNDLNIINRGISGDVIQGVIDRIDELTRHQPSKLFLLIGTNDLSRGTATGVIAEKIAAFTESFLQKSPATKIYVQSILPTNPVYHKFPTHTNKKDSILLLNKKLVALSEKKHFHFIDLFSSFADRDQLMDSSLTNDGLHLKGKGYMLWKSIVFPYVYGLSPKPALIPEPVSLKWQNTSFPLYRGVRIVSDEKMNPQLGTLRELLTERNITVVETKDTSYPVIDLSYVKTNASHLPEEAYTIKAGAERISITAATEHGIFNAIQTLRQLMRDGITIPGCEISDHPAFPWRGLMHDVGRNFQSIDFLKKQIDLMSQYKLSIFHFHLTEDIAWRLQIKSYPQLTATTNMLRDPGFYYTMQELKDLIAYCRKRFITLIPEIDMPGHSAAFKRVLGFDMQTPEGLIACKNILTEVCTQLDVPYIHIGSDEVKIRDTGFLPEICRLVRTFNKIPVAWDPGAKLPYQGTIYQMWEGNTAPVKGKIKIDSRHLYVNHFDPIDGVVSVFNHSICDAVQSDDEKQGAILCVWPDRRTNRQEDILTMNPVYPSMLAFAERTWKGGGWKNYQSDIGSPGEEKYAAFGEFERRLLDHKTTVFAAQPFPYVKQSNIQWKLIGPFKNGGNTSERFLPEEPGFVDTAMLTKYPSLWGGTIWLRHFWHPLIQSHLKNPVENSTYYAVTKMYSNTEQTIGMWIGFYNISRSTNTATPDSGKWDNRNSKIWINGQEITAPSWSRAGRKSTLEDPLIDEGYEYRKPVPVVLKKGWNTILIKAPVASFRSSDWQTPVKWMFTAIPVSSQLGITNSPAGIFFDPEMKAKNTTN
ncbi:MAG: family 20 glycosylhydrolase [Bacteroidota bacterium]